jgi:hypothetical protein
MKKFFFLLLIAASLRLSAQNTALYVAAKTGLSIRTRPDAASKVLDKIPFGTKVNLMEDTEEKVSVKTEGMTGSWKRVTYNGKTGYIIDSYLFSYPVPKATVKDLKGYIQQISLPFGNRLVAKHGTMGNIEEGGYEIRKQLYKNGAEIHELLGYEYGADTYYIPDFNMQQGFLLLRMIPEFKNIFSAMDEFPTANKKYKKGEIEYELTIEKADFGSENIWITKITIEYSEGATYEFTMYEENNQLVVSLSSGV